MKKVFIAAIMLFALSVNNSSTYAQSVVREGKTFKSSKSSIRAKADTLITEYEFEDSKGIKYPIIINKASGACWVIRKSAKTGKLYRQYMKPEISTMVAKELGIEYKPRKK